MLPNKLPVVFRFEAFYKCSLDPYDEEFSLTFKIIGKKFRRTNEKNC